MCYPHHYIYFSFQKGKLANCVFDFSCIEIEYEDEYDLDGVCDIGDDFGGVGTGGEGGLF